MALKGLKVIEILGLAPGPLCGTVLADFGADVIVVQKVDPSPYDMMSNGKRTIAVDFKTEGGVNIVRQLCKTADVFLDTYRPGVMESIGLGPKVVMKENKKLIYARLTGYGQTGSYSDRAGHDINYVSMSGVLSLLSKNKNPPNQPGNLLADFGGGSFMCVLGILLALFERTKSGRGQIIDNSMTEGAAYLASWIFKSKNTPIWSGEPGTNMLDGGFPFYNSYMTKDAKFMAVGALEPKFNQNVLKGLNLTESEYDNLGDVDSQKKKIQDIFLTKTQKEWCDIFDNLDACVTPVLNMDNVDEHDCHISRNSFYRDADNVIIPNPAPKLSRTPGKSVGTKRLPLHGEHTVEILKELRYSNSKIQDLIKQRCVAAVSKKGKL